VAQLKDLPVGSTEVSDNERARSIRRLAHRTIKKVTEDIENRFHFNTAVAAVMEMTNEIGRITPDEAAGSTELAAALREALRMVVVLLSPFVPHIAEELWEALGEQPGMTRVPWPSFDPAHLIQEELLIVIQVNGKKRGEITVPADAPEDDIKAAALEAPNVKRFLEGKTLRKAVLVPGRLLNLVVS
jgi:leucyl-tRNA synthetase